MFYTKSVPTYEGVKGTETERQKEIDRDIETHRENVCAMDIRGQVYFVE